VITYTPTVRVEYLPQTVFEWCSQQGMTVHNGPSGVYDVELDKNPLHLWLVRQGAILPESNWTWVAIVG